MKKNISIPIMPIIIVIVVIVIISVLIGKIDEDTSKLTIVYNKMLENQTYSFTRYNLEENKKTVYRKEDKTLIDIYDSEGHTSTLIAEGDTYLISHLDKEYYVYQNNTYDENKLTDTLKNIIDSECTKGKEKIYGKTYNYEEYNGDTYFLFSTDSNVDITSIKIRFYFKGNELVYLKTIYDVIEEKGGKTQVEEIQTVELTYEVKDGVFEIPSEYAEN